MAKHVKAPASDHAADVLVVGGGPAACWAALTASLAGASVILVDKGYVGTSGCRSTVSGSIPSRNASASTCAARARFGGPAGFGPTGAAPRMCPVFSPPAIPWIGRIWPARPRAEAAAVFSRVRGSHRDRPVRPLGGAGLRPSHRAGGVDAGELTRLVQGEMLPLDRNFFRSEPVLRHSLDRLDRAWNDAAAGLGGVAAASPAGPLREREAAAMTFAGRLAYTAALMRDECRGMHRRIDRPTGPDSDTRRITLDGKAMLDTSRAPSLLTPAYPMRAAS